MSVDCVRMELQEDSGAPYRRQMEPRVAFTKIKAEHVLMSAEQCNSHQRS